MRHAPEFLAFVAENRVYLAEWLGWGITIRTLEDAQNFIKRGLTRFCDDGIPWVGIWLNGRMVGGILLQFSVANVCMHPFTGNFVVTVSSVGA